CCTRVLILHHGRTVAAGTVSEVVALAAAPRSAVVRVAPEDARRARAVLATAPGVGAAEESADRPGDLRVDLGSGNGAAGQAAALRALLDAGLVGRPRPGAARRLAGRARPRAHVRVQPHPVGRRLLGGDEHGPELPRATRGGRP